MSLRENTEDFEINFLSKFASKSKFSKGRKLDEKKCEIRTDFQRDRDRIIHSKSFRRLMHKTQVFISPEDDHFRTRLTHTLEVSQIARTISRALKLNEDLTEAIALGHDLGHTPFGHFGEESLNQISEKGFRHNEHSIRVVSKIEKKGKGLNLTWEVLDGIANHRSRCLPKTLEGKVVRISDKIAYINHDIEDSIDAGLLNQSDLPKNAISHLGTTKGSRINFLINDIILNSIDKNDIVLSKESRDSIFELRDFLFQNVYLSQLQLNEKIKIEGLLKSIYFYFYKNIDELPSDFHFGSMNKNEVVIDYIAGMTDRYALKTFNNIFVPSNFIVKRV